MEMDRPSYDLTSAVKNGKLQRVTALLNAFDLPQSDILLNGYVLLLHATKNNHKEIAKLLLKNGSRVNGDNNCSTTPLHFAVRNGDTKITKMLLDRNAQIDAEDEHARTCLHYAIERKQIKMTRLLLNRGADANVGDSRDVTPLQLACLGIEYADPSDSDTDLKLVTMLLDGNAKIDVEDANRQNPLHMAIEKKHVAITKLLLNRGAAVNARDKNGVTPLHIACRVDSAEIVQILLTFGARSDIHEGHTPLHYAAANGNEVITKLLLNENPDVNVKALIGTPLHVAAEQGHLQIAEDLLNYGAHIDAAGMARVTPLHVAVANNHMEIVNMLLCNGADVNARTKHRKTALHIGCERGRSRVVDHLLGYAADVNARDVNGSGVLDYAVKSGCPRIVRSILSLVYGLDIEDQRNRWALLAAIRGNGSQYKTIVDTLLDYGFTIDPQLENKEDLLQIAVSKGHLKIVEVLLQYGADVNAPCKDGDTPLHKATHSRNEAMVELLISHGADVNVEDADKETPIAHAISYWDFKIIKLLLIGRANSADGPHVLNTAVESGHVDIVQMVLKRDVHLDINGTDKRGRTALHVAVLTDFSYVSTNVRANIAKILLSRGASTDAHPTLLHFVVGHGYTDVVEALIEYKADVNSKTERGIRPLHVCAEEGNDVICRMLLNNGAEVTAATECGVTALHVAAKHGCDAVVRTLLEFGAAVDAKDRTGRTALHIASYMGRKDVVPVLLAYGADVNIRYKGVYTSVDLAAQEIILSLDLLREQYDVRHHIDGCFKGRPSYCKIFAWGRSAEILQEHAVKMFVAGLHLDECYLRTIDSCSTSLRRSCEEEISRMRYVIVPNTNWSFHDILRKSEHQMAILATNKKIVHDLRWFGRHKEMFPIYGGMIDNRLKRGQKLVGLLKSSTYAFNCLTGHKLPHLCTDKMFSFLSEADLINLIQAYPDTDNKDVN